MGGFGSVARRLVVRLGAWGVAGALVATGGVVVEVASPVGRGLVPAASAAVPTGTGGQFVPVQARLMDTLTGVGGYSTPMMDREARELAVSGRVGLPASGISAVQVTLTVVTPTQLGLGYVMSSDAAEVPPPVLVYGSGPNPGTVSNTAIVAVGDDGKIKVMTWSGRGARR